MGRGIINFPTRFLRWVKINGDSDDSDGGGDDSDDNNILILNTEEYEDILITANTNPPIFTTEDIDYESKEDLTISIYELNEEEFNDIVNSINDVGYIPVKIGVHSENALLIDKFEDLNHHYEQDGDMFQDVKIHIHKTAIILPIKDVGPK